VAEAIKLSSSCGSRFNAEILENSPQVLFHRARTDRENGPDVFIAFAGGQPLKHFGFSFCQTMYAWRDRRRTLIKEKEQPFIVFDKANVETRALPSADQQLVPRLTGRSPIPL
jgi:hypothetical protein